VSPPHEILVVEDDAHVRDVLLQVFADAGFRARDAGDGRAGLQAFRDARPPLVVTDLRMPVMDGRALLHAVRAEDPHAAVIILTGAADVRTAIACLKQGAYDFIMKPVDVDELLLAVERALEHRQLLLERRDYQATLERRVREATRDLEMTCRQLEDTYRATLEALGSALDTRDVGTEAHSRRVHGYALAAARAYGLPEDALADLAHGVLLHDIGKIGIPDAILLKPDRLTAEEWAIMRRHPEIGARLIRDIPFLRGAVPIVRHHHERWDGTGYPAGLRGAEIPLGARIFAVVDAFDAMTADRPYSRAISFEEARAEVRRSAGTHFDPDVVEAFMRVPDSLMEDIRRRSLETRVGGDGDSQAGDGAEIRTADEVQGRAADRAARHAAEGAERA
jgi:response regulator RpfG family c-di-GMP phosphodiesterase